MINNVKKHFLIRLAILSSILLLTPAVWAASENQAPVGKSHMFKALVIGVGDYSDKGIKSFSGSANDAQKIGRVLSDSYGFQVKTLTNEKATRGEILSSLGQLADLPQESSAVVIFLGSGEVDQLYDYTYWIPYDAKSGDVLSYISNRQISGLIKKIKSRHLLFVSGSSFPKTGIAKAASSQDELSKKFQGQSRYILVSGVNIDSPDSSDPSSGAFGKSVFSSLKKNSNPAFTVNEFFTSLQSAIPAKSGIKPVFGTMESAQNTGEFLFAKPEAQAALISGGSLTPDGNISPGDSGKEAFLNVLSPVDGAEIYLNGIPWGTTPLKDKKVIGGTYNIKVSKSGYEVFQQEIALQPGEKKDLNIELVPLKSSEGALALKLSPENAIVKFIGSDLKYSPGISIAPGKYQVEVSSFGYDTQKLDLTVPPGVKTEKSVTLLEASNISNSLGMKFVKIHPGIFDMGSPKDVLNRGSDELQHRVKITKPFFIQSSEVTVAQWTEFIKATSYKPDSVKNGNGPWIWIGHKWDQDPSFSWKNPGYKQDDNYPVVCVSWNDISKFITWINSKHEGVYRLPTEAEWEYAARAGSKESFSTGPCLSYQQANFDATALWGKCQTGKTVKAAVKTASYPANSWGIYDMHGNALEWCSDWYGEYPASSESIDPMGAKTGTNRVARGGAWDSYVYQCRSAKRYSFVPEDSYNNLGFRLVAE